MTHLERTQVGIIGCGPAGLLLAHLLRDAGIESVILEARSEEYALGRVRAGLLEQSTVDLLETLGVGERLKREGLRHHGLYLSCYGQRIRIPFELAGNAVTTIYGQREVLRDLLESWRAGGGKVLFERAAKGVRGIESDRPSIDFAGPSGAEVLECDYVAGCDGFHGIARGALPKGSFNEYHHEYPFAWLGVLADVPPSCGELIYAYHPRGFALHSLRSPKVSRLYLQVDRNADLADWPDERIWEELDTRLAAPGFVLERGPITERSVTPLRGYAIDRMQYGRLFLAGDAAHIVPPTGAKGLNLAARDVVLLARGLIAAIRGGDRRALDTYSDDALLRVWSVLGFSHFMTELLHTQSEEGTFAQRLQVARFASIANSRHQAADIAERYVGVG
jgi:p-hydroxybenzoate 3-monooxygenase